jgi:hypothetical protein
VLEIFLMVLLFVLLQWPAWLLQPILRFDLSNTQTRTTYYACYTLVFGIAGTIMMYRH